MGKSMKMGGKQPFILENEGAWRRLLAVWCYFVKYVKLVIIGFVILLSAIVCKA